MSLHVAVSFLALLSYAGLLTLTLYHGLRQKPLSRVFAAYLLSTTLMQIGYLMISLAASAEQALLWYTFMIPTSAAQPIVYYFFTRALLGMRQSKRLIGASTALWLLTAILGTTLSQGIIYVDMYRDEVTGLFLPQLGSPIVMAALAVPPALFLGLSVYNLVRGYRDTRSPRQRRRIQYVLLGILLIWAGMAANLSPATQRYPIDVVANILSASVLAYAILRYRLLDINIVIRKSLLYFVPTVILGTGYFILIDLAVRIFDVLANHQVFFLSYAVAIIAAIAAQPLRDGAQRWIDRALFRERYDGNLMIQRLSRTVTSVLDLHELTAMILEDVTTTMHLQWAALWLKADRGADMRLVAQIGLDGPAAKDSAPARERQGRYPRLERGHPLLDRLSGQKRALTVDDLDAFLEQEMRGGREIAALKEMGAELLVPLRARREWVGVFVVGPKRSRQGYSQDDELILTTLANQTAVAIDNARLHEQTLRDAETKSALLQEVNHRVKNNLLSIMGLLAMEIQRADPQTAAPETLRNVQDRIQGLVTVHEFLSDTQWSPLPLERLVQRVIEASLSGSPIRPHIEVRVTSSDSAGSLAIAPQQATGLALIVNELATNSIKHAFTGRERGRIDVQIAADADGSQVTLCFRDDGPGWPDDVLRKGQGNVGLSIMHGTARSPLRGKLTLENDGGAVATITFKRAPTD